MTAITVVVAQNPHNNRAHDVYHLPIKVLKAQMETVLSSIAVDALETGMLATSEVISLESASNIHKVLIPRATIVIPNVFEASQLSGVGPIR